MISDEDFRTAWSAIGRSDAGRTAYLYLQKIRMDVSATIEPGALQREHGRRSLAAELMGLLARDFAETTSDGTSTAAAASVERPVVFAAREPAGARRRSFREFAAANDPELAPGKGGTS